MSDVKTTFDVKSSCTEQSGLIKIDNIPKFWPILSAIGTPAAVYKLAKVLLPILSPLKLMTTLSNIHFPLLKKLLILIRLFMVSLDVESFTNIHIDD